MGVFDGNARTSLDSYPGAETRNVTSSPGVRPVKLNPSYGSQ